MNKELFYRHFELERAQITKDSRSIDISFSSETPVKRWFGNEILLHGKDNIDLSRIKRTGSLLFNHNPERIIGSVSNIRIEDGKCRALITFDDDEEGNKILSKVRAGSLKGASFGYIIEKFREVHEQEEWEGYQGPVYIATRWAPYEITLTAIPADYTVGVGRSENRNLDGIEIEKTFNNSTTDESQMEEKDVRKIVEDMTKGLADKIVSDVRGLIKEEKEPKMLISVAEATELTIRAATINPDVEVMVSRMALGGKTKTEITNYLFEELGKKRGQAKDGGNNGEDGTGSDGKKDNGLEKVNDDEFVNGFRNLTL